MDLVSGYTAINLGPAESRIAGVTGNKPKDSTTPTTPNGTPIPASWMADTTAEIVNAIKAMGLTPTAGVLQLAQALLSLPGRVVLSGRLATAFSVVTTAAPFSGPNFQGNTLTATVTLTNPSSTRSMTVEITEATSRLEGGTTSPTTATTGVLVEAGFGAPPAFGVNGLASLVTNDVVASVAGTNTSGGTFPGAILAGLVATVAPGGSIQAWVRSSAYVPNVGTGSVTTGHQGLIRYEGRLV